MSIQITHAFRIYCDADFHRYPLEGSLSVGSMAEAKQRAQAAGWRVLANGKVICRDCVAAGKKPRP